MQQMISQFNAV